MTFDVRGKKTESSNPIFKEFVDFIKTQDFNGWQYMGMDVELDPTVCFADESVLVRWTAFENGFNDRLILKTKEQFLQNFSKAC